MDYKQNLHTHSTFCDGKNDPESTIKKAIELGFDSLGFSAHAYMKGIIYSVQQEEIGAYKTEINRLKEKYADKIKIYCGLEEELYSNDFTDGYDYVIGAVHYVQKDDNIISIDVSNGESLREKINYFFGGNFLEIAKCYYENMCLLHTNLHHKMDFVGHFDIIAKFFETIDLIDQDNKVYRGLAFDALKYLNDKGYPFEINTGGMSRGYRSIPYPAPFILKELSKIGGRVLISSDCHDNTKLNYYFEESLDLAKECGFKEVQIFDGKGFNPIPIK